MGREKEERQEMKLTVEVDRNILKDAPPDVAVYTFQEPVETLTELLDLFRRVAQTLTYSCGELVEVENEG